MSIIVEFVCWIFFEVLSILVVDVIWLGIGYNVARLIFPVVTFGKLRVAPLGPYFERFGYLGCRRSDSGQWLVEPYLAGGIGLMVCCLGLAVVLYFLY